MAHAQKPDFVFRRNGRVHLNRRGRQFSRLLAAEVCASAVVMLDTPSSKVVWRVLATQSIRQFPLHFPSPCVAVCRHVSTGLYLLWRRSLRGFRLSPINIQAWSHRREKRFRHISPSVPLFACLSERLSLDRFPWKFILQRFLTIRRYVENILIWFKAGKNIGQFTSRFKYVLLLPAKLNRHKSPLFDWNGIRLLG